MPDRKKTLKEFDRITSVLVDALILLQDQPNVVFCKDCWKKGNPYECRLDSDLEEHGGHRTEKYDYWFCADGEMKENGNA